VTQLADLENLDAIIVGAGLANRDRGNGGAQAGRAQHVADVASLTLFPRASSWYMGANVRQGSTWMSR
jgi:hypothetical protein